MSKNTHDEVDGMKRYLKEIGQYPVLTRQEEMELFQRISIGDQEAKSLAIHCNLRLVVSIAKKYQRKNIRLEDLIQEGSFGLMKAINKFDYSQGYKFSTYATYWIRQSVERSILDKGRVIRVPVHMQEIMSQLNRFVDDYQNENHCLPDDEIILDKFKGKLNKEKLMRLRNLTSDTTSLDLAVNDDHDTELLDFVEDSTVQPLGSELMIEECKSEIARILACLTEREQDVIRMRYGFLEDAPMTLEQIGKELGITRERVRQIEKAALNKLRSPRFAPVLNIYMDSVS